MSGYVGDLSPQQEQALVQLREIFSDVPLPDSDDYFFLRWLRARKFNVKKSEEMLRKHLEMRVTYGVDTDLDDWTAPEVLRKYFPGGFCGVDRDGDPVWYDNFGNLDFRGLHRSVRREDILKLKFQHAKQFVRLCKEMSEKSGRYVETMTAVVDCENISIQRHAYWPGITMLREIIVHFEQNYPERLKQLFVVKAPPIFPMGYNLIKNFIDEKTRTKIHILGPDWREELQKYIAPDQIPQAYGGTRCEPDPWCTAYVNTGGDIPEEYYLVNTTKTDREEMERVLVGRGSTHEVRREVEEPGLLLRWEFFTTDYDISFGVYYHGGRKKKEVVPLKRTESHVVPEFGVHACEKTGTYLLKFDNSYSWMRRKELFYSVTVHPVGDSLGLPSDLTPAIGAGSEPPGTLAEFEDQSVSEATGASC